MALLNVAEVVASVAALLDDPSQTEIDQDYVIPYLNLRWANLVVNLAMLGLQYSEESAIFDLPAGSRDLSTYMVSGGPLASLMLPVSVEWKAVGAPDTEFVPASRVNELADVTDGVLGVGQFAWIGGTVTLPPSSETVTLRVRFQAMSTTLVDPTDTMIRGVGDIIAYRTAELLCSVRGNAALKRDLKDYGDTALDDFIAAGVLRSQSQVLTLQPTHRRGSGGVPFTMPPGSDF